MGDSLSVQCQSAFSERRGSPDAAPNLSLTVEGPAAGNSFIIRCKGRLAREGAPALRGRVLQLFATTPRIVVSGLSAAAQKRAQSRQMTPANIKIRPDMYICTSLGIRIGALRRAK